MTTRSRASVPDRHGARVVGDHEAHPQRGAEFAQQGYAAFVADMYGDAKTADNPKDAGALSSSVMKDPKVMEARFNAARTQLAGHPSVDPARIGAVGYCFGGAVVLNMARAGADLEAVAGFHASLDSTPPPRRQAP